MRSLTRIRYLGLNMAFPSAISSGVLRSPIGRISMPEVRGTQDYFGLNYYSSDTVWFDLRTPRELFTHSGFPRDADLSEHGSIANIPQGLYDSIHWAVRTYPDLPIIITENGVEFVRRQHPPALHRAARPPDLARSELQLAGEGLSPLDAGRQLRMGARLESALRPVGPRHRDAEAHQETLGRLVCRHLSRRTRSLPTWFGHIVPRFTTRSFPRSTVSPRSPEQHGGPGGGALRRGLPRRHSKGRRASMVERRSTPVHIRRS